MSNHKITPEKVTRPIQLLAAWLTGLVIVDGSFLTVASYITSPEWAAGVLVVASVANVPLFLISIFLLQTKYRPEMQEDAYYSKYLEQQYSGKQTPPKPVDVQSQIKVISQDIIKELGPGVETHRKPLEKILEESQVKQIANRVGGRRLLSELYLRPKLWISMVEDWRENKSFLNEANKLVEEGLVSLNKYDYASCMLTDLGIQVATYSENQNLLFAQDTGINKKWWDEQGKKYLGKASN